MKNSRKLFECLYKFVEKLDDNDLEKLCDGEYSVILDKGNVKKTKATKTKKVKDVQKKTKVEDKVSVDVSKFEEIYKVVICCKSREEAKKVLEDTGLTNNELIALGEFLKIKIPKSYNKGKIISRLVEVIVGNKIDEQSICEKP